MKRKLIEVALPLDAINAEAAREKSLRHGHPSTLHLWWARRPLATCRAVLFAQLVDDPSAYPDQFPTEAAQDAERQRLFRLIERLVKWENINDEGLLAEALAEIDRCYPEGRPEILDPFAGGGSIPLEAQRLGLKTYASDLNPVAVLINKALLEIPPRSNGFAPVHPKDPGTLLSGGQWPRAVGLAEDVRYYGSRLRDEAYRRIGANYPNPHHRDGRQATPIAWIWTRTVTCSNPACRAEMPLARSFWLGKKKGKEAWVQPAVIDRSVSFGIGRGKGGPVPDGTVARTGAVCLVCQSHVPLDHIRLEAREGRMSARLMAVVAEGQRQRLYLAPTDADEAAAVLDRPEDAPDQVVTTPSHDVDRLPMYGMRTWSDAFTARQLLAMTTFSDLVGHIRSEVERDASAAGMAVTAASEYADGVAVYLACAISKCADYGCSISSWASHPKQEAVRNAFARQAIPMTWDFAEANPFASSAGSLVEAVGWVAKVIERLPASGEVVVEQRDAADAPRPGLVMATDPPYYDNIAYADVADFFYVWLRRSLGRVMPALFATLLTPKREELVATPYRFGGDRRKAKDFFEAGFVSCFKKARTAHDQATPMTVFYAFKQAEGEGDVKASTGWETLLEGLIGAGWGISATWPMRTELGNRMIASGTNALASSILLACRPRPDNAGVTDRRAFLSALRLELPEAVHRLQQASIAPVDLAQAAIGPGMEAFTRYVKVVEPDGSSMRVRDALGLINQILGEVLDRQEGDFDPDTRWAIKWFDQTGFDDGQSGVAEQLCTTYNVSLRGLERGGIVALSKGRTRLLDLADLPSDWDPATDSDISVWEATHHLARRLDLQGEAVAADLLQRLGGLGDSCRELAYLLYSVCERTRRSKAAQPYNALVASWPELSRLAASGEIDVQGRLL